MFLLTNNVFFKLLSHSDILTKGIFWALVGMSVICWWLFLYKLYTISIKTRQAEMLLARFYKITTREELMNFEVLHRASFVGPLVSKAVMALKKKAGENVVLKSARSHELLKITIDQELSELMQQEERFISFLKVSAETGPLVGLLGTVWGLIHAFNRISERQTADIPTVAPGIAQALVVTLAGLLVAIPALVMYHIIMQKVRREENILSSLADRLEWVIHISLDSEIPSEPPPYKSQVSYETPSARNTP
jgi:biopolymer transport protein TolQ